MSDKDEKRAVRCGVPVFFFQLGRWYAVQYKRKNYRIRMASPAEMAALTGEMPKRRTHMPPVVTAPPPRPKAAEVKAAENVEQEAPAWAELVSAMGQPVNVKQPKGGRVYGMR